MPTYEYQARDAQGKRASGLIEAQGPEFATEVLSDRGLIVDSLELRKQTLASIEIPLFNKIPVKDLVVFSRQFSVLISAKVPLVQALRTAALQTEHKHLRAILQEVANDAESGTPLSVAMNEHRDAFTPFFVNMIKSGETTGRLDEVVNYLADQMERDYDLITKVRGALTYPAFVIFGMVVIGYVMMTFVVPQLTSTLSESGVALPWTTLALIAVSGFFSHFAIQIAVGTVLFLAALRWWISTPFGAPIWDTMILYTPVFGILLQRIYIVRFTRSFATLLAGRVDIPTALEICASVVGNENYKRQILATRKEVIDGNSLTTVFSRERTMPKMVPQMMAIGEESGRLDEVMLKLTDFYSRETQNLVANLVSAIEPLIMLAMGGAVGVMVAAIIMPMYNLASAT